MTHETKGSLSAFKDLLRVLGMGLGYLPAAILPGAWDRPIIDGLTALVLKVRRGDASPLARFMAETLDRTEDLPDLEAEALHRYQHALEGPWARVRTLHRNGWRPQLKVEGLDRIRASQEAGKGTLLWRMTTGTTLIIKKALSDHGIDLVHLSTDTHGSWSEGKVAEYGIGPLYRRTEHWYIKERVIIPEDRAMAGVIKTLLTRLKANEVVSIVGDLRGAQNTPVSLLGATAHLAMGSPSLAWKTGATLLPVYAVREGTGRFRVVVDEPIGTDRELSRKEFVRDATVAFAERMERVIRNHPGSWSGWPHLRNQAGIFNPSKDAPIGT